jgi:Protein of unknown function (DUF3617)
MRSFPLPFVLAALCVASFGGQALAQTLKPGLWEINQKMQGGSGEMDKAMAEMQKQMAALPADQRKMMQDMMARQGVGMGGSGGDMTLKICMTRDMVERNEVAPADGDCRTSYAPRAGNTVKLSFVCTNPPSSGEGQVRITSPEAYSSTVTVTQGKGERVTMESRGRWLSAECGAVKPPAPPRK